MSFDQHMQDAQNKIDKFNKDYEKNQFTAASTAVSKSLDEFNKANVAFGNGDSLGGNAAVLRGMGALIGTFSIPAGPAGAAFAGIVGALLGIISSILESFKPATESMIDKIKKLIMEETLRTLQNEIKSNLDTWNLIEIKIEEWIKAGKITNWESLQQSIPTWETHYRNMSKSFNTLQSHAQAHSTEWQPLFDLNVMYANRFWIYMEFISLLILHEMQTQGDKTAAIETFYKTRQSVAATIGEDIAMVHFTSVNDVDLYASWLNSSKLPYMHGNGSQGYQANAIYHAMGVHKGSAMENLGTGESNCFVFAKSGTLFSIGTMPYTLYFGRPGGEFQWLPWDMFGSNVEQITIREQENDQILVACVYGQGKKIWVCEFDDRSGTSHESERNGWTAGGDWRWKNWRYYAVSEPLKKSILSLGISPNSAGLNMYAFTINDNGTGNLCEVKFKEGQHYVEITEIKDTYLSITQIGDFLFGVDPTTRRSEVSPCMISCVGEDIYSQTGNYICQREKGVWSGWNARKVLGIGDLKVYQARFHADGSQLFATNKGLILRYPDPLEKDPKEKWKIYKNEAVETIWFWKDVASQAGTARALMAELAKAASQPIEDFLKSGS